MREEPFSKKIVDEIRTKLRKDGLDKISMKELIVVIAAHFSVQLEKIRERMERIGQNSKK